MSVTDVTPRVSYNCNGSLESFSFTFPIIVSSDLQVILRNKTTNVATTLTETTDYSVADSDGVTGSLANYENGGTITTTVVPPYSSTYEITFARAVPYTQAAVFSEGMASLYKTFERGLDKLTMALQQLKDLVGRSPYCPADDPLTLDMEMPNATNRAGKYLKFDEGGEPTAVSLLDTETVGVSAWAETLIDDADAATARGTLEVYSNAENDTLLDNLSDALTESLGRVVNLKPVVSAPVNTLDIFTKSGGAVPDATNIIKVAIPDGNGHTLRTRAAAYLSGTSQIVLANATNYWSKGELASEIKTAWLYAIWDGTGIVWALAGYSGFNRVPTTTTETDDDFFLLEASSTYTRSNSHYCVAVAKVRYEYDTSDDPDHTFQATVIDAPQVIWNPRSDYGKTVSLATTITSGADIASQSVASVVVKQSGRYNIVGHVSGFANVGSAGTVGALIKTGSATYGSATEKSYTPCSGTTVVMAPPVNVGIYLNAGDTIHLGGLVTVTGAGNRYIYGDDNNTKGTSFTFNRVD